MSTQQESQDQRTSAEVEALVEPGEILLTRVGTLLGVTTTLLAIGATYVETSVTPPTTARGLPADGVGTAATEGTTTGGEIVLEERGNVSEHVPNKRWWYVN